MNMLRLSAVSVVATLVASQATAQSSGVPLLSFEITAGTGAHNNQTAHTYYLDQPATLARTAATLRLGNRGPVRPVFTYEYDWGCGFGWGCGGDAVCFVAPDNSCRQDFGDPKGVAFAGGIEADWARRILAQVSYGVGNYPQTARFIDANASLRMIPHTAFVVGIRRVTFHDRRGDPVWLRPWSFGLRIY